MQFFISQLHLQWQHDSCLRSRALSLQDASAGPKLPRRGVYLRSLSERQVRDRSKLRAADATFHDGHVALYLDHSQAGGRAATRRSGTRRTLPTGAKQFDRRGEECDDLNSNSESLSRAPASRAMAEALGTQVKSSTFFSPPISCLPRFWQSSFDLRYRPHCAARATGPPRLW